jgi:uncharacterized repeat protein (TIGR04138 family)
MSGRDKALIDMLRYVVVERDQRYDVDAYLFVREALTYTVKKLKKNASGEDRHVSGQELAEGIRDYALEQFGPMALTVLNSWGIERTDDFGEIVFNLIEIGELGMQEEDRKEDFNGVYDFDVAFRIPFLTESKANELMENKK